MRLGPNEVLYGTYQTEREALDVCETLWERRRRAIPVRTRSVPDPPLTVNPWLVIARRAVNRKAGEAA
jgi:hypothetical protein